LPKAIQLSRNQTYALEHYVIPSPLCATGLRRGLLSLTHQMITQISNNSLIIQKNSVVFFCLEKLQLQTTLHTNLFLSLRFTAAKLLSQVKILHYTCLFLVIGSVVISENSHQIDVKSEVLIQIIMCNSSVQLRKCLQHSSGVHTEFSVKTSSF
jgi:hypothetical protein